MLKRIVKIISTLLGVMVALVLIMMIYVRVVSSTDPPAAAVQQLESMKVDKPVATSDGLMTYGDSWFRKSETGFYELYVEGDALSRGVAAGQLTQSLVQYQEKVFNDQIEKLVPSPIYRECLRYFVGWFNRDLDEYVDEEFKTEIYGISQVSSHDYDYIAPAYQRILNYHGAHDIGHALQNMALVGCTSFGTWGNDSEDGSLIIGRNFDFFVGEEFAKNKIIAFYKPSNGYPFMMVTFGGMTGVLSGMNVAGLTVTINAAKSDIPSGAATPVSLVAREILQYATTIEEAYAIAQKRKMFVAESFLIGSAKDHRAAVIEKDTEQTSLYESNQERIVCTNHFQSATLGNTVVNQEHINASASKYRYERVEELIRKNEKNTVAKTVQLLRDQRGKADAEIGLGNEKAINQLIAHHSIIFQPEKGLVWISANRYQLGKFVCYDLNKVFATQKTSNAEIYEKDKTFAEDSFLQSDAFEKFMKVERYRFPFNERSDLDPQAIVQSNPQAYHAYMFSGDVYFQREDYSNAVRMYELALTKEIATQGERDHIEKNLIKAKEMNR
ncbi:C45 family autoproteolytic acyltransferase/hydolase [Pseudochryseolinea flava]|uniref:Peptidase C45 n=1 Tax=Pseudochryseolinea flava TaxID=2059302 RepID=A0A364Y236_9BACT|nr:C45 family peptidase [Pseudochryseolinea flava]RAW00157.1 peptidase C45 [Pseudochryseolinea flava]